MKKVESIKPTGVLADMIDDFKKDLLLKDLAARLPYSVKCNVNGKVRTLTGIDIYGCRFEESDAFYGWNSEDIKPFLRPMSSMTEEEKKEYELLANHCIVTSIGFIHLEAAPLIDWLNAHHFDYRNLVEKGLAIAVTEENNPYKD